MMPSDVIIQSAVCREAARNIYPENPDELFNICWLSVREREIKDPSWQPSTGPKYYFLWLMKQRVKDLRKPSINIPVEERPDIQLMADEAYESTATETFFSKWIDEPSHDEDLQFLKNILTLALYSKNIQDAYTKTKLSKVSFWKNRKLAEKRLYDDYYASNPDDFSGDHLV